jgi:KaiC/GvpD/RAD55 family RecA-like ATPase
MDQRSYIFLKDRASTGIYDLDVILEGGFQKGSSIAIIGPSGFEKSLLGMHMMSVQEAKNYYITTDFPPDDLERKANDYGIRLSVSKYIDMYSVQAGVPPNRSRDIVIDGITALNDLSLEISRLLGPAEKVAGESANFYFHSFSSLLLANQFDSLQKLFQVISGRIKTANGVMMLLLEDGLHDKTQLNTFLRAVDMTIEMKEASKGRWEMSFSTIDTPVLFRVATEGIEIM